MHLKHAKAYLLTNRRVLIKDGIFSVSLTSAPLDKITHLTVKQDFLPKILYNTGDIVIHTAGPTPVELHLYKVDKPMDVKNLMEELIIKEKSLWQNNNPTGDEKVGGSEILEGEVVEESSWSKIKI